MSPKALWRVLHYGPGLLLLGLCGVLQALSANPWAALGFIGAGVVVLSQVSLVRSNYKTGWHDGRVDLTRELARDPDYHGTGKAPEPWTPRQHVAVVINRHDGGDDATRNG